MPTPILMPALSPTMEEGKLAQWLVKEGQKVRSGDVIAEIETDKATMEVEAVDEGTIGRSSVPGGTRGREGQQSDRPAAWRGRERVPPWRRRHRRRQGCHSCRRGCRRRSAGCGHRPLRPWQLRHQLADDDGRIHASPLAKRIAKASGIVLSTLTGTGPNGRILARTSPPTSWPQRRLGVRRPRARAALR